MYSVVAFLHFGLIASFLPSFPQIPSGFPVEVCEEPNEHAFPLNGGIVMHWACSRFCADAP